MILGDKDLDKSMNNSEIKRRKHKDRKASGVFT